MKSRVLSLCVLCLSTVFTISAQNKKMKFSSINQNKTANTTTVSSMYSFSTFTAAYVPIGGASLTGGLKWDDLDYSMPIGFNFSLYGQTSNTLSLFEARLLSTGDVTTDPILNIIAPMFEDLCDRAYDPNVDNEGDPGGISNISYTTTGTPGNRICKIQVSNAGFYEENSNGPSVSNVNFQTWLYETSNIVEIRYGLVSIQNAATNLYNGALGFVVGLADSLDANNFTSPRSNMLDGGSSSPTVVPWSSTLNTAVTPTITNGRVYRFTMLNSTTGLNENIFDKAITIFPNPAKNAITLHLNVAPQHVFTAKVLNQLGQTVSEQNIDKGKTIIDLQSLNSGLYFIQISNEKGIVQTKRFVKE
jgi:hypothetical protein